MTKDEFLAELRKTPRGIWYIGVYGEIRTNTAAKYPICPINYIAGVDAMLYDTSAALLGLPTCLANTIAHSADGPSNLYYDPNMRRELLDACGLKERN